MDLLAAIFLIIFRGSDARAQRFRRRKHRIRQAQRLADGIFREGVEILARQSLDDLAQQNKSEIGIFDVRARPADQRLRKTFLAPRLFRPPVYKNRDAPANPKCAAEAREQLLWRATADSDLRLKIDSIPASNEKSADRFQCDALERSSMIAVVVTRGFVSDATS